MTTAMTIQETARATGLSVHTLRYYERIGLIKPVPRKGNGHRLYRADDIGWIEFLLRLRATGMPIEQMQRYAQLREAGSQLASVSERKAMLERHACVVEAELATLRETLAYLRTKIGLYSDIEAKLKADAVDQPEKSNEHGKRTIRKRIKTAEGS